MKQLNDLFDALTVELRDRIANGTATSGDLSVARQFLRDNGIEAQPVEGKPLADLAASLPVFDEDAGEDVLPH